MTPAEARELFLRFFQFHFGNVQNALKQGTLNPHPGTSILFPTILLFTDTKTHYVIELLGASSDFRGLSYKRHKEESVNRYISQFSTGNTQAHLRVDTEFILLDGLCVGDEADLNALARRFPIAEHYADGYRLQRNTGAGSLLNFGPSAQFTSFLNCAFVHRKSAAYRLKYVLYLAVISKTLSRELACDHLNSVFCSSPQVRGVHYSDQTLSVAHIAAGQLQSMYLQPDLRETTLGEFFRTHRWLLLRALGADDLVYEPHLHWQVPQPPGSEKTINPDALLRRPDGNWDILDFKTAVLGRQSITRGQRSRRRFIDYVSEGIAQLAHYREYFAEPANQAHANDKYGVEVLEPRCVLLVGNYENANPESIAEASRQLRDITIIDYDTLVQLFMAGSRV
jgi:Shedu protein SduA, C-terminal